MIKRLLTLMLNTPWNVLGLGAALISIPNDVTINRSKQACVFTVQSLWWARPLFKFRNVRAVTVGQVVILSPSASLQDINHEYVHVEQSVRMPLIHPILYTIETIKNGYENNKYEKEAYRRQ